MLSAYIQSVHTEEASHEDPAGTRERLKDRFPRGATRRMTQLGMLVGSVLEPIRPAEEDTLVYASEYAETRALESYLDSFPSASPTLFQTSIHPSAVQQWMILQQQPVKTFFPMTGRSQVVAHALEVALLGETRRMVFCGGEERGTWLLEKNAASDRTFAFALVLSAQSDNAIGQLSLNSGDAARGSMPLGIFFDALRERRALELAPAPGRWLKLSWS